MQSPAPNHSSDPTARPPGEVLSIIVPVFNEEQTIAQVISRLRTIDLPIAREILVVDDGSTDGTGRALDGLAGIPDVRVLRAARNGGKGSAIRLGLEQVSGTIVGIQDADLELDPAELRRLVAPILSGQALVVYGSRFLASVSANGRPARRPGTGVPWSTRIANRALTGLANVLYGTRLTDMETCYKMMRTSVARSLDLHANRFDIEPEITAKLLQAGHTIVEIPVSFSPRSRLAGKKIRWHDGIDAIGVLVKCRWAGGRSRGRT